MGQSEIHLRHLNLGLEVILYLFKDIFSVHLFSKSIQILFRPHLVNDLTILRPKYSSYPNRQIEYTY